MVPSAMPVQLYQQWEIGDCVNSMAPNQRRDFGQRAGLGALFQEHSL